MTFSMPEMQERILEWCFCVVNALGPPLDSVPFTADHTAPHILKLTKAIPSLPQPLKQLVLWLSSKFGWSSVGLMWR